jgi:hypothetical protein
VEKYARKHAGKLMGVKFADVGNSTCSEAIEPDHKETSPQPADGGWVRQTADEFADEGGLGPTAAPGADTGAGAGRLDLPDDTDDWDSPDVDLRGSEPTAETTTQADETDETEVCGGEIVPMGEAVELLADDNWRDQATYAAELEAAYEWWRAEVLDEGAPDHDGAPPPPEDSNHIV